MPTFSNHANIVKLDGFKGRLQKEYNMCPVGPYYGPYDQNENLELSYQNQILIMKTIPRTTMMNRVFVESLKSRSPMLRKNTLRKLIL